MKRSFPSPSFGGVSCRDHQNVRNVSSFNNFHFFIYVFLFGVLSEIQIIYIYMYIYIKSFWSFLSGNWNNVLFLLDSVSLQ